jgi:histidyl-tRNA synthetase
LSSKSLTFWEEVERGLRDINVDFVVNPNLVRGLDYYCDTAFEFVANDSAVLGQQQATVLAGGR